MIHCINNQDPSYQLKLNRLLKPAFFDFQPWFDKGYWTDALESYSITDENDGEILSHAFAYHTTLMIGGRGYPAVSVGGVATREGARGRGLSRQIIEFILEKYDGLPIYLSANEDVMEFYPRFGFRLYEQKNPVIITDLRNDAPPVMLKPDDPKIWDYVKNRAQFSPVFDCKGAEAATMLTLGFDWYGEALVELPSSEALAVCFRDGAGLWLMGVFAKRPLTWAELSAALPFPGVKAVMCGFMPPWPDARYTMGNYYSEPWFVKNMLVKWDEVRFPDLAMT